MNEQLPQQLKLYLGQLDPTVGALKANARKAIGFYNEAVAQGADYALLSELFLTGYSVRDLVWRDKFMQDVAETLGHLTKACSSSTTLGIGAPTNIDGEIYNAYYYLQEGKIIERVLKTHLPNDECFNEKRIFKSGDYPRAFGEPKINTAICEDLWHPEYGDAIGCDLDILFVPNASPYFRNKIHERHGVAADRADQLGVPVVYVHMATLEDELAFDGGSFIVHPDGEIACQLPLFDNARALITFEKDKDGWRVFDAPKAELPTDLEADYRCMVEAVKDYAAKTGFETAVLGLSGGVDSALVAAIAADALGPENVRVLMMPSKYTSQSSLDDALDCAKRMNIVIDNVSIAPAVDAISSELEPVFGSDPEGLTAENIQPRLRATLLMALSNKYNALLLTTGNKSEVAVGYATLYGDMAGGYNPLKDLYKQRVFEICKWRNRNYHADWMLGNEGEIIPVQIIQKPPSAELRPDQKDSDSLPDYHVLDPILEMLIDEDKSVAEIVSKGYEMDTVLRVQSLVYIAEYKRFQAAPGVKLTRRQFGTDRRYPIINHWRDEG